MEETGCLSFFFFFLCFCFLFFYLLPFGRNWLPVLFFFFFECLGIQFFNSLPFLTQSVRLPLVTYPSLCSTYATYGTLCHAIGHQVLPTQPLPREAKDFPRGDNHSKHNPLLTYLAWLQPIYFNLKFVFIRVNTAKVLLVVKTLIKNIEQQPH